MNLDRTVITVRLPGEMRDRLRLIGAVRGETIGGVVRALIRSELERVELPVGLTLGATRRGPSGSSGGADGAA